ncbi:MAG: CRISPR-associated protein Cas4, partial [Candidatus Hadarchaeum sp.]|uniref:CRISPR-associated protein Cas4 n=1 Tax=Candidatus Hadarchaeum sp. TaxID=2883567 RepID=UPI003D13C41F
MKVSPSTGEFTVLELFMYFYCPRELYFCRKLGFTPPPLKKMDFAKTQHEKEEERCKRRMTIYGIPREEISEILHDLFLEDKELGLCGKVDTVLKLASGEIIPVEVKYSNLSCVTRAWRKQIIAYAVLLEKSLGAHVSRGLIYILPSRRIFWVKIFPEEKGELKKDIERMFKIIQSDSIPKPVDRTRCSYCEFQRYCKRV